MTYETEACLGPGELEDEPLPGRAEVLLVWASMG